MFSNYYRTLQRKRTYRFQRIKIHLVILFFITVFAACKETVQDKQNGNLNGNTSPQVQNNVDTSSNSGANLNTANNPVPENTNRLTLTDTNKTIASPMPEKKTIIDNDLGAKNVKQGGARIDINLPQLVLPNCVNIIITAITKLPDVESVSTSGFQMAVVVSNTKTTQLIIEKAIADAGFNTKNFRHNVEAYNKLPKECKDGKDRDKEEKTKEEKTKDEKTKDEKAKINDNETKSDEAKDKQNIEKDIKDTTKK